MRRVGWRMSARMASLPSPPLFLPYSLRSCHTAPSHVPGTVLPQSLCTHFSGWDALPHLTIQAWIKSLLLRETLPACLAEAGSLTHSWPLIIPPSAGQFKLSPYSFGLPVAAPLEARSLLRAAITPCFTVTAQGGLGPAHGRATSTSCLLPGSDTRSPNKL